MVLPAEMPVMTLPDVTLFPQATVPLFIFEPRYRRMLHDALHSHRMFVLAMQKPGRVVEKPARVAGLGVVRASVRQADGTSNLLLQGIARVELGPCTRRRPYRVHRIRLLPAAAVESLHVDALVEKVRELASRRALLGVAAAELASASPAIKPEGAAPGLVANSLRHLMRALEHTDDPSRLADMVSSNLLPDPVHRQEILATVNVELRLGALVRMLMTELVQQSNDSAA
jgi:Lon protease-like protein